MLNFSFVYLIIVFLIVLSPFVIIILFYGIRTERKCKKYTVNLEIEAPLPQEQNKIFEGAFI